jgi:hypothetical protein
MATAEGAPAERAKLAIDYEKYRKISNAIVTRLRENEEEGKDEGMTQSQVIDWYLEKIEDELDSEEALLQERKIVSLVIKRLYQKVGRRLALLFDCRRCSSFLLCLLRTMSSFAFAKRTAFRATRQRKTLRTTRIPFSLFTPTTYPNSRLPGTEVMQKEDTQFCTFSSV